MAVVRPTRVCMLDFFCYGIQFYFLVLWDHGFHVESDHGCTSRIYFDNAADVIVEVLKSLTLEHAKRISCEL